MFLDSHFIETGDMDNMHLASLQSTEPGPYEFIERGVCDLQKFEAWFVLYTPGYREPGL